MKKRILSLWIAGLVLLILVVPTFAHSGGTDGEGGHRDSSTGEYHYHHGYPAHQHTDGICPYDFEDKTGQNSGTSSSKKPQLNLTKIEPEEEKEKKDGPIKAILLFIGKAFAWCFLGFYGLSIGLTIIYSICMAIYDGIKYFFKKK